MSSSSDQELLRQHTEANSEEAFAELTRRYVDLVYSAALRMVCDKALAEDVTQSVFVALAKQAPHLRDRAVLSGWLHRTAVNIAAQTVRTEVRRRAREKESALMNELSSADHEGNWQEIAPHLDRALDELSQPDREAILLRYFESKSAREISQRLGTTEDTAQRRLSRAVARLRDLLLKRGVNTGITGLAAALTAHSVQAAPSGLALAVATSGAAIGGAASTPFLIMTTVQKAIVGAAVAAAIGVGIYEERRIAALNTDLRNSRLEHASLQERVEQLAAESDSLKRRLAQAPTNVASDNSELLRMRAELAQLRKDSAELAKLKGPDNDAATLTEATQWRQRVALLRERFAQTPSAAIPELALVTERDWLDAAKTTLDNEAEFRRSMSAVRANGERKVANMLQKALGKFSKANNGQIPTNLAQLTSHLETPLAPEILERWDIVPQDKVRGLHMGSDILITQKAPVDPLFDSRFGVGPNGYGSTDFFSSASGKTVSQLYEAFKQANGGDSPDHPSQLISYARTPEQESVVKDLILRASVK